MKKALLAYLALSPEEAKKYKELRHVTARNAKLSLEYLCPAIEKKMVSCEIIDQSLNNFSLEGLIAKIKQGEFLFVGFYSHLLIREKLIGYLQKIRNACGIKLIVGGPGSVEYEKFLENGCDIVCHGEGEKTVGQIIDYLEGKIFLEAIKGISYKENGLVLTTKPREFIENLDEIDFPAREKIPLKNYDDFYMPTLKKPYTTMIASRGCPYSCIFCFSPCSWNGVYRARSVANVMQEIDFLVKCHKIRYIIFRDDVFGFRKKWLEELCLELIKRKYNLGWMCNFYPRSFNGGLEEALDLMKNAGCNLIHLGIPSVNSEILQKIKRPSQEPLLMERIIGIAKKKGIITVAEFIFGLPGETRESIQENIKYVFRVKPHFVNFHPLGVSPFTELGKLYGDKQICGLDSREIYSWCGYATRKFYLNFNNLTAILTQVFKKNPFWIKNIFRFNYFNSAITARKI